MQDDGAEACLPAGPSLRNAKAAGLKAAATYTKEPARPLDCARDRRQCYERQ
jgi:hypothetical protein